MILKCDDKCYAGGGGGCEGGRGIVFFYYSERGVLFGLYAI